MDKTGNSKHQTALDWVALLFLLITPWAFAEQWPEFPYPDHGRLSVVGDQMQVNGVPMQMFELASRKKPAEVLDFYRHAWRKPSLEGGAGFSEIAMDGWQLISRIEEPYLFVVQVGEYTMGTTVALLSLSTLPVARLDHEPGEGFPSLGGTEFALDLVTDDPGKHGRTLQFHNRFSVMQNYRFYRRRFEAEGWGLLTDQTAGPEEAVLMMARGSSELNMTFIRKDGKTHMVAVQTR
ncbi:MAG: hypothetical protein R3296_12625 [Oleiphilaceae bacterium]|nr:hypothetical protein [Oleiphilaceae bacterium]